MLIYYKKIEVTQYSSQVALFMGYRMSNYSLKYKPTDFLNQFLFKKYCRYVNISVRKCFQDVKHGEI